MFKKLTCGLAMLALTVALAATAASAGGPYVYTDAAGDNASAPDIRQVTLTDNGNGTVGVAIDLAATIPDDGDSCVIMLIDADRNATTGADGFEFLAKAVASGAGLGKWDGSKFVNFPHQSIDARAAIDSAGTHISFVLTLSDLGTQSFDFVVGGAHGDDVDAAPEHGLFAYPSYSAAPVPTTTTTPTTSTPQPPRKAEATAASTISGVLLPMSKLTPKAGSTFAAPRPQLRLSSNAIVAASSVRCTLTLKGTALKPLRPCVWKLPKTTKGKTLTLSLTLGYQGATTSLKLPVMPK